MRPTPIVDLGIGMRLTVPRLDHPRRSLYHYQLYFHYTTFTPNQGQTSPRNFFKNSENIQQDKNFLRQPSPTQELFPPSGKWSNSGDRSTLTNPQAVRTFAELPTCVTGRTQENYHVLKTKRTASVGRARF
jgi:hypothetical protein